MEHLSCDRSFNSAEFSANSFFSLIQPCGLAFSVGYEFVESRQLPPRRLIIYTLSIFDDRLNPNVCAVWVD
jgi:hypothetical protein